MTVADVLRGAAAEVRKGWTQGMLEERRSVCALGAIGRIESGTAQRIWDRRPLAVAAIEALGKHLPILDPDQERAAEFYGPYERLVTRIASWNNQGMWGAAEQQTPQQQTAENVALMMEFAALCWEQEQAGVLRQTEATEDAARAESREDACVTA